MLYKNDLSKVDTFKGNDVVERRIVPTQNRDIRIRPNIIGPADSKVIEIRDRQIVGPIGITCHLCGEQYRGNNYDLHLKACHRRRGTSKESFPISELRNQATNEPLSKSSYTNTALAIRSPTRTQLAIRSALDRTSVSSPYRSPVREVQPYIAPDGKPVDTALVVANSHLSTTYKNQPIHYQRRTTKRPLPCPHCYRAISAERLNTHIEETHGTRHTTTILSETPKKEDLKGIWAQGRRAKKAEDFVTRRQGNAPACYLCGDTLGTMSLQEHFETCEGRPTLNDGKALKKIRTRTIDYSDYSIPSLTNTGDIGTDYNNIKSIRYPQKDSVILSPPPKTVYVEGPQRTVYVDDSGPKIIQYASTQPYVQYATTQPRYLIADDDADRNLLVKQITFPGGKVESINQDSLTKDWKLEPYTVLGSSFAQRKQSLRRLPKVNQSLSVLPAYEEDNALKVVSINGRVSNHKGSQSYKKLKDPFKYENISLLNGPYRTVINETIDTKKAFRGSNSSLLGRSNSGQNLIGFGQPDSKDGFFEKRGNTITSKPLNPESPVYAIYEQSPVYENVYQVEPVYKTLDRSILLNRNQRTLLPSVTQVITQAKPESSYSFQRDSNDLDWEAPFKNDVYGPGTGTKSSTSKFNKLRNSYQ